MESFLLWGHRGASAIAPENTLSAFVEAEAAGADGVELDVHLSGDGVPVVIHDDTVDRTTDGSGPVGSLRIDELRQLDAGSWFSPRFGGELIPSLEEVLVWATDRLRLNIEIKSVDAGLAVLALLRDYPGARALVSSFDHDLLAFLRREDEALPLGFLCDSRLWSRALSRALDCAAASFHPRRNLVSRPLLAACRRAGLAVYPWTVDRPAEIRRLLRLGASGLFTNDPTAAREALSRPRPHPLF